MMENVFLHLLNMSLTAAVLVVVVLLLRLVFHKAPRWIHCLLWALVAVRLLCPFAIESNLSLMPSTPVVTVPDSLTLSDPVVTPNAPTVDVIYPDTPATPVPPQTDVGGTVTTPVTPTLPDSSVAAPGDSVDPWQVALTVATYAWLLGVLAMLIYAAATTLRLRLQVREAVCVQGNLWQCDHLRSPFILGVLRPRIYLPSDLDSTAQASVIAHEKAHLKRLDHLWKPLGFLLLAVYWFNPVLWVAYIFLCRDIEAACDEQVVRNMTAADRKAYSEALMACSAPRRLVSACPLAFGETSVKSRIKSVLSYKKPTIWIVVAALLVSTVAGVCLLTDRPVAEQEPDDPPSASDEDDTPDTAPVGKTIVVEAYSWMGEEELRNLFGYLPESNPALSSTYVALPVKVLYSRAELDAVLRSLLQDDRWQKMDFSAFDEAFFEENHLVMTHYKAGTGSAQPTVGAYVYTEEGACLSVRLDVYKPYLCDAMLGEWLLFSGIQKEDMTGVTKKEAYVEHIIPTDHFIAVFDEPREQPTTTMEQWKEREFLSDAQSTALHALLRRLADENAWQKAASVDRAFTFVGCVNVGAADYYVPSDFSALLSEDGMLGWLTAQEAALISEWFPKKSEDVTPPSGDLTDINAQVTGAVLSWNKEEEYVLLKVNPQYSEELGETLKVYTRYASAGCAPEVGNALRVLYAGYVQEGFPNAIYAASLWNATTYSILETGVDLYDDLLRKIVDYCYGLAPSAEAPNCSYLIFREHLDPMFDIGIKVVDLDKNGQNDLLISAYNGFYGTRNYVYDAYTIQNGKLVHLLSSGERSQYYLHQDGYIEHQWSGGAALSGTDFYRLTDGALVFVERVTHDDDYAVEIGLADSLASITEVFWFHTTHAPGDSNEGYEHITAQQAKDILDAFTAAHPPLNINFLQLEKGGSGSSTTTVPPTTTTTAVKPTTITKPTVSPTEQVTFVKFSRPADGPSSYHSYAQYMYPVQPDAATCAWLRQLASKTNWVKRDTYSGDYDAYFTIGDDENYYYIDRINQRLFHNRRFASLTKEELDKLDILIRSYGIQNNSQSTSTVRDWRYLTGRVEKCVEGQDGYVVLKLDNWWANTYGENMRVSTRFIPYRYFAKGSMVCVVYDGEAEPSAETESATIGPFTIYAGAMNVLEETTIVSTGVPQYDNLLKQIQDYFYKRSDLRPNCSSAVWDCEALSDIGIKLIDLDQNGQDELVIGATNSTFWVGYSDVYTIKDGQLVQLYSSNDNHLYSIHKGGHVCQEWTEDTLKFGEDYYRIEGDKLVYLEGLMFDIHYASSLGYEGVDAWFRVTVQGDEKVYEHITEAEAKAIADKYGKNDLLYTLYVIPFSL